MGVDPISLTMIGTTAASMGMQGAQAAMGGGGGQQRAQVPGPEGNPMSQNPLGQQQGQMQMVDTNFDPFGGGMPGGGGWL